MRHRRPTPRKGWFGVDRYARFARGLPHEYPGTSFADSHVHSATELLKFEAFPGSNERLFEISGAPQLGVDAARDVLLDWSSDLWDAPNITMEFHQYLAALVRNRVMYLYVQMGEDVQGVRPLERLDYLAPETVYKLDRRDGAAYEQLVIGHPHRDQAGWIDEEGPRWFAFDQTEIAEFSWPLAEPRGKGSPSQIALREGRSEDLASDHLLLQSYAQAFPDEWHLPVARARMGSYGDPLQSQRQLAARTLDLLYHPLLEPATQYFEIQRLVRGKIAASTLRAYLIREFNRQVLTRWAEANAWSMLELKFRPKMLNAADWADVWREFESDGLSYIDIVDLIRSDQDASRAGDR